jgi:hypothetical protein
MLGRIRGERRQRIHAFDTPLGEVVRTFATECHGSASGRADQQPADVRMILQGADQVGVALLDLLQRQPAPLLHQVDEAEVA